MAVVEATTAGSRSRRRASQAAATVARALDWPEELVSQLRELGKGYSAARSQSPRELPRDDAARDTRADDQDAHASPKPTGLRSAIIAISPPPSGP